ncbi:MAG: hypothetical protein NC342_02985 [Pseudoflavonifractor sp.]|nr:hypothetical protein [Alloprevotella sp.]MCM1116478.1 hypothetical protein [Pseudoflavonifractor sp.]
MNDEKWLDDIRNKMLTFEADSDPSVWDSIEARLPAPRGRRGHLWLLRARRVAAVAAALLLLLGGVLIWTLRHTEPLAAPEAPFAATMASPRLTEKAQSEKHDESQPPALNLVKAERRPAHSREVEPARREPDGATDTILTPAASGPAKEDNRSEGRPAPPRPDYDNNDLLAMGVGHSSSRNGARVSGDLGRISIGASSAGELYFATKGRSEMARIYDNDLYSRESGDTRFPASLTDVNVLKPVKRDSPRHARHHQPIKGAMTVSWTLDKHWSIEGGLSYSSLSSELFYLPESTIKGAHQKLHYIGVPLGLRYRFASLRSFDFYASASFLTEICVGGQLRRQVQNGAAGGLTIESMSIREHRPQLSVGLAPGLQWNALPFMGVYAEPGIGYYFNNGSTTATLYKDHQLNFNISIGLRLMLNR